jgi:hypothetical protein
MEKSSPEMCAASVIFKPRPKVNNHPFGENLPNLVTLSSALPWPKVFLAESCSLLLKAIQSAKNR